MSQAHRVSVIDSHTGGEPVRVVVSGGPDLGGGTLAERLARFRSEHDLFRSAVVNEPRGSDLLAGALLCRPVNPGASAGAIFFDSAGYLDSCIHGTMSVVATLAHLGRIAPGRHLIETPAGDVTAELQEAGTVSVRNVPSYRGQADVPVQVEGYGPVIGDVAYGGGWFFLVSGHGEELTLANVEHLMQFAGRIRQALAQQGITGTDGAGIDHIELFGPAESESADIRSFVLCPGKAYGRSPSGTGVSAKLACLAADGVLAEGAVWRQESITGTIFEGSYEFAGATDGLQTVIPAIKGSPFVNAEGVLLLSPADPFCYGIRG
ncbi:MAG: proline racemase family protein [Bryobacterales bacterium]|nr:proline racemase family protein [Bryobacterales bacterium]